MDEDNGFNYEDYAYVNSNVNYEDFVKKLHFSFNDKSKLDMIYEIKENIISNITRECTQIGISVDDNNANKILNLIMDKFYISTVENSNTETMSSIETMNKISKSDFIEILRCYETEEITYINNLDIHRCIKTLENEERNFVKSVINSYCGAYREKLLATYKEIEREIINILGTSETYKQLIEPFLFKQYEDISFEDISSLFKIINQLTLLAVFNEVDTKKIELVNEKESVDNIELKELIRYCFKYSASSAYRKTQSIISPLIREYKDNPQLNENQIFVLNLDFKRNGKPCESKLNPDLVDITQTEENLKDFKLFQGMCYKCTACLDLESEDASTKENIENFLDCGRS